MSAPIIPTESHTALTHALQHLRHAMRLVTTTDRLIVASAPANPATQRCAILYADIAAAARSCANLIDHLDGYGGALSLDERRQTVAAAMERHPAGSALGGAL
ncbi:hypothetical protein KN246_15890 [Mycobacterium intracellulare]|uniref:hypothetical protein n=1 Tax=Mycobacterium intracellulare TaxID=1767 RepID=UPI001E56C9B7|nr:hypothetical protein [Mycobacterium intracellulare]UGT94871.1 hypothetical protein LTQ55_13810 [Mycobacterium intracellulare]UQB95746.1 hypothetical protein KN246_15890 [Mycobacterium intracellulare]